ncbi:MAG TPA: hypothetical protein VGR08_00245 [Thermomicrobiales bacterium]|nr:hypothetical protein [Thermomicrobiales bacterium]
MTDQPRKPFGETFEPRDQPLTEPQIVPGMPSSGDGEPMTEDGLRLRRYDRPREVPAPITPLLDHEMIRHGEVESAVAGSALSDGARHLLRGLLAVGAPAMFAGGGVGIDYGSLLKTAARPEYLAAHIREASAYLHAERVNLLIVPGMSGYPVGSMYSIVSGIPAVLLKKQKHTAGTSPERAAGSDPDSAAPRYPAGSFVIPSYTGDGDVVMSADLDAFQNIIDDILRLQLDAQEDAEEPDLLVRVAGADDIIDKATMSQAVSESALVVGKVAIERFIARHRARTGDQRRFRDDVQVVAWVTPLIKGYNRPHEHMRRWFGITPFAGLNVTSVHLDPPAIGIDGLGIVGFAAGRP